MVIFNGYVNVYQRVQHSQVQYMNLLFDCYLVGKLRVAPNGSRMKMEFFVVGAWIPQTLVLSLPFTT